jgi:DNA-directed RNA polymerase subunit RPC12/RpoP
MKYYQCPECEAKLEYLNYSQNVTEYGDYSLPADIENDQDIYNGDHNCNDSSSDDDCYYTCPECEAELDLGDVLIIDEDELDDKEEEKKKKKKKKSEEGTKIIVPTCSHAESFNPWDRSELPDHVICSKCKHIVLVAEEEREEGIEVECPKCNNPIIIDAK